MLTLPGETDNEMFTRIENYDLTYKAFADDYEAADALKTQLAESIKAYQRTNSILYDKEHLSGLDKLKLQSQAELLVWAITDLTSLGKATASKLKASAARVQAQYNKPTASVYHIIVGQHALALGVADSLLSMPDSPRNTRRNSGFDVRSARLLYEELFNPGFGRRSLSENLEILIDSLPENLPVIHRDFEYSLHGRAGRKARQWIGDLQSAVAELRKQKGMLNERNIHGRPLDGLSTRPISAEQRQRRILVNSLRVEAEALQRRLQGYTGEILIALEVLFQKDRSDFAQAGGGRSFVAYLVDTWHTNAWHYDLFYLASVYCAAQKAIKAFQKELNSYFTLYSELREYVGQEYAPHPVRYVWEEGVAETIARS